MMPLRKPLTVSRLLLALSMLFLVAACSVPRGAALQSEILKEADKETPTFEIVSVSRDNLPALAHWPVTGWSGGYHWINRQAGATTAMIQPGDKVSITVWDSQANSLITQEGQKRVDMQGIEVSTQGTIYVPYVEEVYVRGLTADSARRRIQSKLEEIVPTAQVQLSVEQGLSNSIDLVSGVAKPGTYPLPNRNYTILSLISSGGGISNTLRNPLVRLIRGNSTYEIPAADLLSSAMKNTTLRPGDKVIVEEDERSFTSLGAAGSERIIYFPKEAVTALEALSLMGGITDHRADPKGVLILREYKESQLRADPNGPSMTQVVFTVDMTTADGLFAARNFNINPGDTVLATESPVTKYRTVFELIGSAIGLGNRIQTLSE